jgi:hypothetical protein
MKITREDIEPHRDVMAEIRAGLCDAFIAHERVELAAVSDDYTAWMVYPPTSRDDPVQYAPYWSRLANVVTDDDEREAIVARWLESHR